MGISLNLESVTLNSIDSQYMCTLNENKHMPNFTKSSDFHVPKVDLAQFNFLVN